MARYEAAIIHDQKTHVTVDTVIDGTRKRIHSTGVSHAWSADQLVEYFADKFKAFERVEIIRPVEIIDVPESALASMEAFEAFLAAH